MGDVAVDGPLLAHDHGISHLHELGGDQQTRFEIPALELAMQIRAWPTPPSGMSPEPCRQVSPKPWPEYAAEVDYTRRRTIALDPSATATKVSTTPIT